MRNRSGFTLIELLTVIAIIAILAAITFPVFARAKDSAYRNGDISAMNNLRTAVQLYRVDQGAYPPALLGYVTLYTTGPNAGNVIPANALQSYLYPKRIGTIADFKPANNRFSNTETTNAVFPAQDPTAIGSTPILDLTGDGAVTAADDIAGARQAFGPADGNVCFAPSVNAVAAGARCTDPGASIRNFYRVSGYDVTTVPMVGGGQRTELRYSLFWTNFSIGVGAGNGVGNQADDPRQLGYNDPPEDALITWNTYFREYTNGVPANTRRDIALFVGGSARPFSSKLLNDFSWRQRR